MIEINDSISLKCFDKNTDMWFIDEVNGESKSNFIHQIEERLLLSRDTEELEFSNAYLVKYNNDIVGYVYLTSKGHAGNMYFEYLVLKKYRGMGIGSQILESVTDKIFEENTDLRECKLSIDKSNIASQMAARNSYFFEDEDTIELDKMDFIKDNPYYISRKR